MRIILLYVFILSSTCLMCQEPLLINKKTLDSFSSKGFNSLGKNNYGYHRFFQEFKFNESWLLRLELTQMMTEQDITFELPILIKHRVTERFSVLFGPKIDLNLGSNGYDVGASLRLGVQYDITKHWYVEGGFEYQLKSAFPQGHFKHGAKGSFYLGSGLKF